MSDEQAENAFAAGRELTESFFRQAEELAPRMIDELLALRRDYLRASAEGVRLWLDLSEELLNSFNLQPKISPDLKNMARDVSQTWIKAEQEAINGAISVARSLVRASAAGSQAMSSAAFRAASAGVAVIRSRVREPERAAQEVAQQVGAA